MAKSIVNENIVRVPAGGKPSGPDYGERGISQGNDAGTPSAPAPDPRNSSVAS